MPIATVLFASILDFRKIKYLVQSSKLKENNLVIFYSRIISRFKNESKNDGYCI